MWKLWLREFYVNGKWAYLLAYPIYLFVVLFLWGDDSNNLFMMGVLYGAILSFSGLIRDELRERHILMQALPIRKQTFAAHRYIYTLTATVITCAVMGVFALGFHSLTHESEPMTFTPQLALVTLAAITVYVISVTPLVMGLRGWGFIIGAAVIAALHIILNAAARYALHDAPIPEYCRVADQYDSWMALLYKVWSPGVGLTVLAALVVVNWLGMRLTVWAYASREV